MTALTTHEMILAVREWLPTQTEQTQRELLTTLRDMARSLLSPEDPPAPAPSVGLINSTTQQLIDMGLMVVPQMENLAPREFLINVRDTTNAFLQQLPKWKASMFFPKQGGGVDSSLNWANIDVPCSPERRKFMYQSIVAQGGDTLIFIAEKLYNNPALQSALTAELTTAYQYGIRRVIVSIKNDNSNFSWGNMQDYIRQLAHCYRFANPDQLAFMSCLETDEVLSVGQTQQMEAWCKLYAPHIRFIVGSQNASFLKAIGGNAELWLEIHTQPFRLSQADADRYIADLQSLLPYNATWAGEFWGIDSGLDKYISRRAIEIGCAGVGSFNR